MPLAHSSPTRVYSVVSDLWPSIPTEPNFHQALSAGTPTQRIQIKRQVIMDKGTSTKTLEMVVHGKPYKTISIA